MHLVRNSSRVKSNQRVKGAEKNFLTSLKTFYSLKKGHVSEFYTKGESKETENLLKNPLKRV